MTEAQAFRVVLSLYRDLAHVDHWTVQAARLRVEIQTAITNLKRICAENDTPAQLQALRDAGFKDDVIYKRRIDEGRSM